MKLFNEFNKVNYYSNMGKNVAVVNIKTGELMLNKRRFNRLPSSQKKFILFHELGHLRLSTKSELLADRFALNMMVREGLPLDQAIYAMTSVLDQKDDFHIHRIETVLKEAKQKKQNLQPKTISHMDRSNNLPEIFAAEHRNPVFTVTGSDESAFLGLGAKAAARRKERRAQKQQFKIERISARGDARAKVAEKGGNSVLNTLGDTLKNVLGGGGIVPQPQDPYAGTEDTSEGSGNTVYIIAGVIVVVVIGIFLYKRSKG